MALIPSSRHGRVNNLLLCITDVKGWHIISVHTTALALESELTSRWRKWKSSVVDVELVECLLVRHYRDLELGLRLRVEEMS